MYVAQEIPQIDTEIAQKGHFLMETNYNAADRKWFPAESHKLWKADCSAMHVLHERFLDFSSNVIVCIKTLSLKKMLDLKQKSMAIYTDRIYEIPHIMRINLNIVRTVMLPNRLLWR